MLPAESSTRNHVAASSLSPQVARKGSTLSGFVQRSRLEREVGRDLHSNKWEEVSSCIRQSGQSGEGCRGSPMEKRYETRSGDLFVEWLAGPKNGSWAHFPLGRESRCNLSIQIESSKATTCRLHPSLRNCILIHSVDSDDS